MSETIIKWVKDLDGLIAVITGALTLWWQYRRSQKELKIALGSEDRNHRAQVLKEWQDLTEGVKNWAASLKVNLETCEREKASLLARLEESEREKSDIKETLRLTNIELAAFKLQCEELRRRL